MKMARDYFLSDGNDTGRVGGVIPNLLKTVRSGTRLGIAASKEEGILYSC